MYTFPPPDLDNRPAMGWPEAMVNIVVIGIFAAVIFTGLLPVEALAFSVAIHLGRIS
ncbi:hypothetical protein ACWGII_00215 [Streptomyces sp. NPDC054855]